MFLANCGCGKFQPINAPIAIQNSVSNIFSPILNRYFFVSTRGKSRDKPQKYNQLTWFLTKILLRNIILQLT
jgi:hypothetical protein